MYKSLIIVMEILFFVIGIYALTLTHETAHQKILAYNGIDSDIKMNAFGLLGAETVATTPVDLSDGQYRDVMMLNALNEIYGYQLIIFYTILVLNLIFLVIAMKA